MKAILDTNIFVSAVLGGRLSMVLDLWRAERKALGVSDEIVQEYIEVLRRPKFKLSADQVDAIAAFVLLRAEFVAPAKLATAIMAADPDDDLFLFAAEAGSADYLVSGDHHLQDMANYRGIPIVTGRDFLGQLERETPSGAAAVE